MNLFHKIWMIAVVVLLFSLLVIDLLPMVLPQKPIQVQEPVLADVQEPVLVELQEPAVSNQCKEARLVAQAALMTVSDEEINDMAEDYDFDVYNISSNINQQIFKSNEHVFLTLMHIRYLERAMLGLLLNCK